MLSGKVETHTPLHSYIYLMFISLNLMMGKVCETWVIKVQKRKKARDYGLAPLSPLLFKEVSARTQPLFLTSVRRVCFHWHVVFSIKSSSCLSCVTSRQYYCVVHSKVSFTRREQMDFCFHCSRCALVYKDLFQSGVINGNNSLFWTKQLRRGQEMVNNLYAHW